MICSIFADKNILIFLVNRTYLRIKENKTGPATSTAKINHLNILRFLNDR